MTDFVTLNAHCHELRPSATPAAEAEADSEDSAEILQPGGGGRPTVVCVSGKIYRIRLRAAATPTDPFAVEVNGARLVASVQSDLERRARQGRATTSQATQQAVAPLPGRVVEVFVQAGDSVEKGQPLLVIEAMKMENEIASPAAGEVREVAVAPGDAVETDQILVSLR